MHILLVLAHPLAESFAATVARTARDTLKEGGHTVDVLDLYQENFVSPRPSVPAISISLTTYPTWRRSLLG
jgi:NAD(P)H dehydrogenase (quinone)